MGNRSRFVAATAAAAGLTVAARRRARLRAAAAGVRDAILPSHLPDATTEPSVEDDEAHAPGHRHLPPDDHDEPGPPRLRSRPWTKHAHGMTHPFSGR